MTLCGVLYPAGRRLITLFTGELNSHWRVILACWWGGGGFWPRGSKIRVRQFYLGVNLAHAVLFACFTGRDYCCSNLGDSNLQPLHPQTHTPVSSCQPPNFASLTWLVMSLPVPALFSFTVQLSVFDALVKPPRDPFQGMFMG